MLLNGSVARIFLRGFGMLINALTYAIAARALSPQDMGIWALATALTTITLSFDVGLSSTLRNRLASKPPQGQILFQQVFSLSLVLALAYVTLILVAAVIVFEAPYPSSEWWTPLRQTTAIALLVGSGLILLRLPFNLAANTFYSYNEPDFPIYWEFFNFVASFVFLTTSLIIHSGPILSTFAFLLGGLLTGFGCTAHLLRRREWTLRLRYPQDARIWIKDAAPFGFLQLVGLGLTSLPSFLVGALVRIDEVTPVRACMILCQAILSLHLAHAMPIWTEFTQLRGSTNCEQRLLVLKRRLRLESKLLVLAFTCLALVLPYGIKIWLNQDIDIRVTTAFCVWGAGCGICNLYSLITNGGHRPLLTAIALVPGAMIATFFAWILAPQMASYGVAISFGVGAVLSASIMMLMAKRVISSAYTWQLDEVC